MAKAGRPKYRRASNTKYSAPKDAEVYRVKRLYWALLLFEDKMMRDVSSVKMSEYQSLLKEYTDLAGTLKQKGKIKYKYGEHNPDTRMDYIKAETGSTKTSRPTGVSQDGSVSVGTGISSVNPLT